MEVKIEIIIEPSTSVLGALGIRGARVTITPRQKRKQPHLWIDSHQQTFYFYTIAEAREGLDSALATEPRAKVKILRRLRKAGLFWDLQAIHSYCQKLAVTEDAGYSFTKCTSCAYAPFVPHGWVTTKEGRLISGSLTGLLYNQVTNFKDLIFRTCPETVHHDEIPLEAALWVIYQGAHSGLGLDSHELRELLHQDSVRRIRGQTPTNHKVCQELGPST